MLSIVRLACRYCPSCVAGVVVSLWLDRLVPSWRGSGAEVGGLLLVSYDMILALRRALTAAP